MEDSNYKNFRVSYQCPAWQKQSQWCFQSSEIGCLEPTVHFKIPDGNYEILSEGTSHPSYITPHLQGVSQYNTFVFRNTQQYCVRHVPLMSLALRIASQYPREIACTQYGMRNTPAHRWFARPAVKRHAKSMGILRPSCTARDLCTAGLHGCYIVCR